MDLATFQEILDSHPSLSHQSVPKGVFKIAPLIDNGKNDNLFSLLTVKDSPWIYSKLFIIKNHTN